jgi:membrane-bound ClpP family serine protease
MDKKNFAFGRMNFILLAIGVIAVVLGFILMSGSGSTETEFNPEIFSALRIKVAPVICFLGFVFIGFAIMYKSRKETD